MSRASLRFANDLLRRLGEELTPSPVNGIIELVKNSYDADSLRCDVTLILPEIESGEIKKTGTLTIEDWGEGMDEKDLREGWLILGRSRKSSTEPTDLGRRPVGDKGLGRLAALRMGRTVRVVTRPKRLPGREFELYIDWARFENKVTPNQVVLQIKSRKVDSSIPSGTKITIEGITKRLDSGEMERLNRGLLLIANPFAPSKDQFSVNLLVSPLPRQLIASSRQLFRGASFKLSLTVDSRKKIKVVLHDGEGEPIASAGTDEVIARFRDARKEDLVPMRFDLWIYILKPTEFEGGAKELRTVRAWLKDFGGVHVFLDGIRVAPYGDSLDDWVGMNSLRASSPELAPQTKTSIGYVALENLPALKQKTDRSGFIESPTVDAIRELVRAALRWQQSCRIAIRDQAIDEEEESRARDKRKLEEELSSTFDQLRSDSRSRASKLFARIQSLNMAQESLLRREVELYRTLGTAGIAASVFAHEAANNSLSRIRDNATSVEFRIKKVDAKLLLATQPIISRIVSDVDGLLSVSKITLSLVRARNRKKQRFGLLDSISSVVDLFEPYFLIHNVKVACIADEGDAAVMGSRSSFECILVNLVTNALQAFERGHQSEPKVRIELTKSGKVVQVDVTDNGPGIVDIAMSDIWIPGETTRDEGTGLGLAIVKAATKDLGGSVSARARSELGGAGFTVSLPILP